MTKKIVVIMAGGLGKRMNSSLPKVLLKILDKPMICILIDSVSHTYPTKILIIVGKYRNQIKSTIEQYFSNDVLDLIEYIDQPEPLGTGNAIKCALPALNIIALDNKVNKILILSGDTPLLSTYAMNEMFNNVENCAIITNYDRTNKQNYDKFKDYGKVISSNGSIVKIIEKKDCSGNELDITCVNCGIYCYQYDVLEKCINLITNNNSQNEYYLTDIIEIAANQNIRTHMFELQHDRQHEIIGVNTKEQLIELEKYVENIAN